MFSYLQEFFRNERLPKTSLNPLNIGTLLALVLNIGLNVGPHIGFSPMFSELTPWGLEPRVLREGRKKASQSETTITACTGTEATV